MLRSAGRGRRNRVDDVRTGSRGEDSWRLGARAFGSMRGAPRALGFAESLVLRAPALPGAGISNRHDPRRKSVQASAQHPPEEAALGAMTAQVPVWRAVLVVLGVAVRCLLGRGLGTVRVDPRGDRGNSSDVGSAAHQGSGGPGARRGLPRAAPGVPKPDSRCPLPGARGAGTSSRPPLRSAPIPWVPVEGGPHSGS